MISSQAQLAEMIHNIAEDVRRGGTTFIAMTVITRNAIEKDKPIVMVCKFGDDASPNKVAAAFASMANDAVNLGALVPD